MREETFDNESVLRNASCVWERRSPLVTCAVALRRPEGRPGTSKAWRKTQAMGIVKSVRCAAMTWMRRTSTSALASVAIRSVLGAGISVSALRQRKTSTCKCQTALPMNQHAQPIPHGRRFSRKISRTLGSSREGIRPSPTRRYRFLSIHGKSSLKETSASTRGPARPSTRPASFLAPRTSPDPVALYSVSRF